MFQFAYKCFYLVTFNLEVFSGVLISGGGIV